MKRLICFSLIFFLLISVISYAQPFGPPTYVADPVKMDCKYYFAGDQRHFNPRPENYTVDIGYTTDFKSQEQACEMWRCAYTNGTIKADANRQPLEKDLCMCSSGYYWDDVNGCVKLKETSKDITFLQLIWNWIRGIF
ncbi:MAG: hypothetical protein AABX32_03705 [Nanoarchaeota archaeon]